MKKDKKKIKKLVKKINEHIEMATIFTNELNRYLDITPMPFDEIKKININDVLPPKKSKPSSDFVEYDEIEKGEIITYSAFDRIINDDEY